MSWNWIGLIFFTVVELRRLNEFLCQHLAKNVDRALNIFKHLKDDQPRHPLLSPFSKLNDFYRYCVIMHCIPGMRKLVCFRAFDTWTGRVQQTLAKLTKGCIMMLSRCTRHMLTLNANFLSNMPFAQMGSVPHSPWELIRCCGLLSFRWINVFPEKVTRQQHEWKLKDTCSCQNSFTFFVCEQGCRML